MSAHSKHILSAAASIAPGRDRYSVQEMAFLRTLAGRLWWVGVAMMGFGVLVALAPLLGRPTGAELLVGLLQGGLTVLIGELTRQVGVAFRPPDGGYGRSVEGLWEALRRLSRLYGVYVFLLILVAALLGIALIMLVAALLLR
jgi:hypothetical protein